MFIKKILIDLDGVLNQYGNEKYDENSIPALKDGAKEFLEKLKEWWNIKLGKCLRKWRKKKIDGKQEKLR